MLQCQRNVPHEILRPLTKLDRGFEVRYKHGYLSVSITFLGVPSIETIFLIVFIFLFSFLLRTHYMFRPLWAILSRIYIRQYLEAIMPTTDPLFLLGYTIVIFRYDIVY
jgi:hypothetical protein